MKRTIIRLAYVILGFLIGLIAGIQFTNAVSAHRNAFIIAFVTIGIIIALIIESSAETDSKKIFYFVFYLVLIIPISWFFQYLGAVIVFLWKIITSLFRIWF